VEPVTEDAEDAEEAEVLPLEGWAAWRVVVDWRALIVGKASSSNRTGGLIVLRVRDICNTILNDVQNSIKEALVVEQEIFRER
jgi:hypothetical protein